MLLSLKGPEPTSAAGADMSRSWLTFYFKRDEAPSKSWLSLSFLRHRLWPCAPGNLQWGGRRARERRIRHQGHESRRVSRETVHALAEGYVMARPAGPAVIGSTRRHWPQSPRICSAFQSFSRASERFTPRPPV